MTEAVVLVHGIWMTGLDCLLLRARLTKAGFPAEIARYASLRRTPRTNARHVREAVDAVDADVVHLVGHSLGGLVILHMLRDEPPSRPGRVVLLGSPVHGSGVARVLAGRWFTRFLIGRSGEEGLLGGGAAAPPSREIGTIAGDLPLGVGRVVGGFDGPHDGTVAVAETRLAQARDHVTLPVSHTGLLTARIVADQVLAFLRRGAFETDVEGAR
jgi:pimeloyl-ACP methyl ester carboxylesterase